MSRNYQTDRTSYDPYDQDYDSGYSGQTNEYRDLYNPYKSLWQQAVKARFPKQSVGKASYYKSESADALGAEGDMTYKEIHPRPTGGPGYQKLDQPGKYGRYGTLSQSEEQIFDSGYDVTRRNTYGSQTTGYGPRD